MFAYLIRQGAHPSTAALKVGTRLRRLAAALAAVTIGLLASAATIPAAFASDVPQPGSGYELGRFGPVPASTAHVATTGGMPGWQIILIAVGAVLVAAAATIVLARARSRPVASRLSSPARLVRHTSREPSSQLHAPARAWPTRRPGPAHTPRAPSRYQAGTTRRIARVTARTQVQADRRRP